MCIRMCICTFICICRYIYVYAYVYVYMYVHVHAHVYLNVYVHVCMLVISDTYSHASTPGEGAPQNVRLLTGAGSSPPEKEESVPGASRGVLFLRVLD